MQRLSMFALAAIAVLALSGVGFRKKAAPAPISQSKQTMYYWFSAFDGSYNDYATTAYEISEMETFYDCTVTTQPQGGTLIEEGYLNPNVPHDYPVMVYLYGHF